MTHNQIDYGRLKEEKRHNLVTEGETFRHNVRTEDETQRHNVRVENETSRHNVADETETRRHNIVNEIEVQRHNVISETELNRHNVATEQETHRYNTEFIRHNQASEALQRYQISVQDRANSINAAHYERSDRQNALRVASEISVNNARISNLTANTRSQEASTTQQQYETAAYTGELFRPNRVTSSDGRGGGFHGGNYQGGTAYASYQQILANTDRTRNQVYTDTMGGVSNIVNAAGNLTRVIAG